MIISLLKLFFELAYKPSLVHPMGLIIICLRLLLPASWSDLPVHHMMRTTSLNLFDLAPGGVYKLNLFQEKTGGLLHHLFTLAYNNRRSIFCCTFHILTDSLRYKAPCPAVLGLSSLYMILYIMVEQSSN